MAHFDPKEDNYVTTNACNTCLGATLWQKEGEMFRPVAFASRFFTDCEKKYAIIELELLGALWGLDILNTLFTEQSKSFNQSPGRTAAFKTQ